MNPSQQVAISSSSTCWNQYRDNNKNMSDNSDDDDDSIRSDDSSSDNNNNNNDDHDYNSSCLSSSFSDDDDDDDNSSTCNYYHMKNNTSSTAARLLNVTKPRCWDDWCLMIQRNDPDRTILHLNDITTTEELYKIGIALMHNTRIRTIIFYINELEQILFYSNNNNNNYNHNNNNPYYNNNPNHNSIFHHSQDNNNNDNNYVRIHSNENTSIRLSDTTNDSIQRLMEPLYIFLRRNTSLRNVTFQNGSGKTRTTYYVAAGLLNALSYNKSVTTVRIFCLEIPLLPLSNLLSSSSSRCHIQRLEMDLCTIITMDIQPPPPPAGTVTINNDENSDSNVNTVGGAIVSTRDQSVHRAAQQLANAFGDNKSLQSLLLYRLDEVYVNAIIVQLRSHPTLKGLSLSMPGVIVLGLETSIHTTPSIGWSSALGNVLLASQNSTLQILQFHSIKLDDTMFRTLCRAIRSSMTLQNLAFEYCRCTFDNPNISIIQNYYTSIFRNRGRNDGNGRLGIVSDATTTSSTPFIKELIIRQTSYHTNGNLLLSSLPIILSNSQCTIQKLIITSLSEIDFSAVMESMRTNISLRTFIYEYNTVEHESFTDTKRCEALIRAIPYMNQLQRIKIGLGVGISDIMTQQLLQAFYKNTSLYHIRVTYLGAHPFFTFPSSSGSTGKTNAMDNNRRKKNSMNPIQYIQNRNRLLPSMLRRIATLSYTNDGSVNRYSHDDRNDNNVIAGTSIPPGLIPRLFASALEWNDGTSEIFRTLLTLP